jgi:beta-glucosidase
MVTFWAPVTRLPVTLPRTVGQVPIHAGHRFGGGHSQFWGDYTDGPTSALFTLGHGLSYTTFAYDGLHIRPGSTRDVTEIEITITNTGGHAGEEVVQLYVTDEVASVARPRRRLIGFGRVDLQPGERRSSSSFTRAASFYDRTCASCGPASSPLPSARRGGHPPLLHVKLRRHRRVPPTRITPRTSGSRGPPGHGA